MKIYKTYFSKEDTPFNQLCQPKRKYHTVWKRNPYQTFLGHKVVKVKLFGIFKIKGNSDPMTLLEEGFERLGIEE
jgi:hypothetical protein